jgi:hypothetical protein
VDKGKRITGAARDKLAAELKTAYESGASIRASPTTPHARPPPPHRGRRHPARARRSHPQQAQFITACSEPHDRTAVTAPFATAGQALTGAVLRTAPAAHRSWHDAPSP